MPTVAIDFGGTRIKLGVVDRGRTLALRVLDAEARAGLAARLPAIEQAIRDACAEAGIPPASCRGVGMALPCLVRGDRIVSAIDKYPDATTMDLPAWGRAALGLPVVVENDANAALAGEWQYGAAAGFQSVVLMTLGTGIGTSAVIDGVPLRGQHGQAGCLGGHVTVNLDAEPCVCGNIGCAESQASTWALPQHARRDAGFAASALAREPVLDYRAIFAHADAGDALARKLRDRALKVWSAAAVTLVHAYDPEAIVLGGGIMKSPGPIVESMQAWLDRHAWVGWGKVKVVRGRLDDSAALLGLEYLVERAVDVAGRSGRQVAGAIT
jgi:glucokinase